VGFEKFPGWHSRQLGELMMILELHRQGLSVTAIARRTGRDPKTVCSAAIWMGRRRQSG